VSLLVIRREALLDIRREALLDIRRVPLLDIRREALLDIRREAHRRDTIRVVATATRRSDPPSHHGVVNDGCGQGFSVEFLFPFVVFVE
jgi:hypothetical protein